MFKLKRFDKAQWFEFPDNKEVKLKIRPLSKKLNMECLSNSSRLMPNVSEGSIKETPSLFIYQWEIFSHCLDEWKGVDFGESDGQPSRQGYLEALFEEDGIREFVIAKASELTREHEVTLEQELKNSESSQAG